MNIIHTKVTNGTIWVLNDYLTQGRPKTYLNDDVDSGGATITVFSIAIFAAGNYYAQIGETDSSNAEIIKMHASTAPTGNTITLAANLANNHSANEPVYFLGYNQIEYNTAPTDGGTKTVLATNDADPTHKWSRMYLADYTTTDPYIVVRFKNEGATTYTGYSDYLPIATSTYNSVDYLLKESMRESKAEFSETLTPDYLISQINECLREIRKHKNKISWTQSYNSILGQTAQGVFKYAMPTDIFDKYSTKAINSLRIGAELPLEKVGVDYFFSTLLEDVKYTQVRTAVTGAAGTTTLEIDNSYDFASSGSIVVGSVTITYSGVTRSATAGVLTGVPASGAGSMTASIAEDDYVFQNASVSSPERWTTFNGNLYIYPLPGSDYANLNVYSDYFKTITSVDSASDVVDYIQYDMIKNWLKWKIRAHTKNDGVDDMEDSAYLQFLDQLRVIIRKDRDINAKGFRNIYDLNDNSSDFNPRQIRNGQI